MFYVSYREERRAMTRDELKLICLILNTADYCNNTIPQVSIFYKKIKLFVKHQFFFIYLFFLIQLEDKLKEKIEEYKYKINLDIERDYFFKYDNIDGFLI